MLRTGSILSPRADGDGLRISIMSRHTLDDGVTPNPRIKGDLFDEHWPELAPSLRDVGAYYRGEIPFAELADRYRAKLVEDNLAISKIGELVNLATERDVTVLCIEDGSEVCHRGVLAQVIMESYPDILVECD